MTLLEIRASRPGRIFRERNCWHKIFWFDEQVNQDAVELYIILHKTSGNRPDHV